MLNHKEVGLLLSELPLKGSYIQKITEHDYHSFTLSLFEKEEKAWLLYVEIATANSHFCRTGRIRKKSGNTQRFAQYLKSHIIGALVTDIHQLPFDRAFILTLSKDGEILKLLFRFYSGPGANIMVLDEDDKILELMFRRPKRNEAPGCKLVFTPRESEGDKVFSIRQFDGSSFNAWIDKFYSTLDKQEEINDLVLRAERKRDRLITEKERLIRSAEQRLFAAKDFENSKRLADLLSSSLFLVKKGMDRIVLDDWQTGGKTAIPLNPAISARENLDHLYAKYQKDKKAFSMAEDELKRLQRELEELKEYYCNLLAFPEENLAKLRQNGEAEVKKGEKKTYPGLIVESGTFTLLVGRNAKENDEILRRCCRGNDWWVHTRDYAGGYVIIKAQKDKSVPLETLLDASMLAIHYSKAKNEKKADLYYTQVKYLRRVKDGKTGLVLATQEKNLTVEKDEIRIRKLLEKGEER